MFRQRIKRSRFQTNSVENDEQNHHLQFLVIGKVTFVYHGCSFLIIYLLIMIIFLCSLFGNT